MSIERLNRLTLAIFGPLLALTGALGLLAPGLPGPFSTAPAYDLFHIVCGALGTALVLRRRPLGVALFNLIFGLLDLYQAAAQLAGWFPLEAFRWMPADLLAHVVIGGWLTTIGAAGLRRVRTPSPS